MFGNSGNGTQGRARVQLEQGLGSIGASYQTLGVCKGNHLVLHVRGHVHPLNTSSSFKANADTNRLKSSQSAAAD